MEMICHLDEDIFSLVKDGIKDVEVRVNDEKRRKLSIGDNVVFLNRGNESETLSTTITSLDYYDNFESLVKNYSIERMYKEGLSKEDFIKLLERFYTKEEQEEYGVVALVLKK